MAESLLTENARDCCSVCVSIIRNIHLEQCLVGPGNAVYFPVSEQIPSFVSLLLSPLSLAPFLYLLTPFFATTILSGTGLVTC